MDSRITYRKNLNLDLLLRKCFKPLLEQDSGSKMIPSFMVLTAEHEVKILGLRNNIKIKDLKEDAGKTTISPTKMLFHMRAREQSQPMTIDWAKERVPFSQESFYEARFLWITIPCSCQVLPLVFFSSRILLRAISAISKQETSAIAMCQRCQGLALKLNFY